MTRLKSIYPIIFIVFSGVFVRATVGPDMLQYCKELAYSTEEDFVTRGPEPPDGNPIISDGDLLGKNCAVCARNGDLLSVFEVSLDVGLDAVDVIDVYNYLVAFSTELDSPNAGQFFAGDLLVTNGAVIPNTSLTYQFNLSKDLGLDGIQFVGSLDNIIIFLEFASGISRAEWVSNPSMLVDMLTEMDIDIWYSTEGTAGSVTAPVFLDGDILSVKTGAIVHAHSTLLPASVPAGVPTRGVDFGVDAFTTARDGGNIHFSTELMYEKDPVFTDGDVWSPSLGLVKSNLDLIACFEPTADFVGLDALFMSIEEGGGEIPNAAAFGSDPSVKSQTNEINQVGQAALEGCRELAFSTEEDFVTQGPVPPDGNPIISDGDLLGKNCAVCARNADLLSVFEVSVDLGLDAVDVIDVDNYLVAFSTELDSPNVGQFYAGDLLVTNGAVIPNQALTYAVNPPDGIGWDAGLDSLHFVGDVQAITGFLGYAATKSREDWLSNPGMLASMLLEAGIDIWYSTEGTPGPGAVAEFLDGDVLSARTGDKIYRNATLLPASVPAGIPVRGVDFGVDAFSTQRNLEPGSAMFSTEILFRGEPGFNDGDVLLSGSGVVMPHTDLIICFEPKATFVGLDALSVSGVQWPYADFGDAPDSTNHTGVSMTAYPGVTANFPTVFDAGTGLPTGPMHLDPYGDAWLGSWVTLENDADLMLDEDLVTNIDPASGQANRDRKDDGVMFPVPFSHCQIGWFSYTVTIPPGAGAIDRYVNVWFDWNRDGDFNDILTCSQQGDVSEWAVQNQLIPGGLPPGTYVFATPNYRAWNMPANDIEGLWMRISIAEQSAPSEGDGRGPSGGYLHGETEDYYLPRECTGCADWNGNSIIDLADLYVLVGDWLWTGPAGGFRDADLDCDGKVNLNDFAILARQWLGNCP